MTFKKGDLVMVVRPMPCCGVSGSSMGKVFRFIKEYKTTGFTSCCKRKWTGMIAEAAGRRVFLLNSSRLIKINPPSDDTEEVADKELEIVK